MIAFSDRIESLFGLDQFRIRMLSIRVCERNWSWEPPVFTDFDFWCVMEGRGVLRLNGVRHHLEAGVGFLFQPGDEVAGSHDPDAPLTVFACHLDPVRPFFGGGNRLCEDPLQFRLPHIGAFRGYAEESARALHQGEHSSEHQCLLKLLVAAMVVRALSGGGDGLPEAPAALQSLVLDIKARPGIDWSLSKMAKRSFLSIPQFTRNFRRFFGSSPQQFVIRMRIQRAVHLLRESQLPIKAIAESLGYEDHFFFHRQFKSVAGVTPLQVRHGAKANPCVDSG